jgi:hypothetical protein
VTKEEHQLLYTLFAVQQHQQKIMLDMLRAKELISEDDAAAFRFAADSDVFSNDAVLRESLEFYRKLCKLLKVPVELPEQPPQSNGDKVP